VVSRLFRSRVVRAVLTASLFASLPALAGGFSIFEAGARAMGMGGAFVAQADDPSAMFYNPAGMAFQQRSGMFGGTFIYWDAELSQGFAPFPGEGYTAKQEGHVQVPPVHFYVTTPLPGRFKDINLSIGAWTPFGLSTKWEDPNNFRGRFLSQRADLRHLAMGFQLSAKLTPWLAIGGGPELRFSDVKLQRNVAIYNPFIGQPVDAAHLNLVSDGIETDVTWGAGLMLAPIKGLRFGAAYHAHVYADYEGSARFFSAPTGNAQLDAAFASRIPVSPGANGAFVDVPVTTRLQFPSVFMFGVSYDICDRLTVEADGNYWGWSTFDKTVLTFATVDNKTVPESTLTHNWENTWTVRGGVRYAVTPKFDVALGGYYDQTPQPDEDVNPLLPDSNRTGITAGLGVRIGEHLMVEASNLVLFFHDRTTRTNADNFNATYKTFADLFTINVRASF